MPHKAGSLLLCVLAVLSISTFSAPFNARAQNPPQWDWPNIREDDADGTFFVGFPQDCNPDCPPPKAHPDTVQRHTIRIASNDAIHWDQELLSREAYGSRLEAAAKNKTDAEFVLVPDSNAPIDGVLPYLVTIHRSGVRFGFIGNDKYRNITRANNIPLSALPTDYYPISAKPFDPVLTITATDEKNVEPTARGFSGPSIDGKCRVFWMKEARPVDNTELLFLMAQSFKNFSRGFSGNSMAEANQYFDNFGAYLRYASGTPFRCIGGAMSIVQSTGAAWVAFAPQPMSAH